MTRERYTVIVREFIFGTILRRQSLQSNMLVHNEFLSHSQSLLCMAIYMIYRKGQAENKIVLKTPSLHGYYDSEFGGVEANLVLLAAQL